jgi:hypothetical protein
MVCTRPDGTMTMQHQRQAFFASHDLTHFAVETVLGFQRAFYGLLAEGWGLDDFGPPWPRGPLPEEAEEAERIVGFLDLERGSGVIMSAEDVNASLRDHYTRQGLFHIPRDVTDEQLAAVRRRRGELLAQWAELAPGAAIELTFPR